MRQANVALRPESLPGAGLEGGEGGLFELVEQFARVSIDDSLVLGGMSCAKNVRRPGGSAGPRVSVRAGNDDARLLSRVFFSNRWTSSL